MSVDSVTQSSYQSLRIGGLASGLDTDTIVEDLMEVEQYKVDSIEAEKQEAEWMQEAYREIIEDLTSFKSKFYDILNPETSILSNSSFKEVEITSTNISNVDSYIEVLASEDSASIVQTINSIVQLATEASVSSSAMCKESILGDTDLSLATISVNDTSFDIRLDGVQKSIEISQDYTDINDFQSDLQTQVDSLFGDGRIDISISDGKYIEITADNSVVQVISGEVDTLAVIGISSGDMNKVSTGDSLESNFGETEDTVSFTINEVEFSFSKSDSITGIMEEINSSSANVKLTYSDLSDEFSLTSTETGAGSKIEITNTSGSLFGVDSYINIVESEVQNGQDAIFYLNDDSMTNPIERSSNVFTIDEVTYSLKKETSEEINVSITNDVDAAYDNIKLFIDSYNSIIESITEKLNESVDYDYDPLTDAQKDEMSDDEITNWELKAKSGILKNESLLQSITFSMRKAFYTQTEGLTSTLSDIGLSTGSYTDYGKISIDENELKTALYEDFQGTLDLINKDSSVEYSKDLSQEDIVTRFEESSFAQRIFDILQNSIRTTVNENGYKGLLLEKAGMEGDTSNETNVLTKNISDIEERIEEAIERMQTKEDGYWSDFTALENALYIMNQQSSWISEQFSE